MISDDADRVRKAFAAVRDVVGARVEYDRLATTLDLLGQAERAALGEVTPVTGVSSGFYGAQNPAPSVVGHVEEPRSNLDRMHEQQEREFAAVAERHERLREDVACAVIDVFHRPPLERYVRATVEHGGCTFEPAVEWREGDDFDGVAKWLEDSVHLAADAVHAKPRDQMQLAEDVGRLIARRFEDRAYFVEVWQEGRRGFAQVFQPFGVPRHRP